MQTRLVASFEHYGVAPFEVEALFSILNGAFTVQERKIDRNYEDNYACMININFPIEFNEKFFEIFGRKRWDKMTFLIKEMRRRTGKKGVMLLIHFTGRPALSFTIAMRDENLFEFALDKMEILHELISLQTDSKRLPLDVERVNYEFDPRNSKWSPTVASGNDTVYKYYDGEWMLASRSR